MDMAWLLNSIAELDINWLECFFVFTSCSSIFIAFVVNYGELYFPAWLCQIVRYGRANLASNKSRLIRSIEVPKSWFAHFYVYAVCLQIYVFSALLAAYISPEPADRISKSTLFTIINAVGGSNRLQTVDATTTVLASLLFLLQVSRRLYENWFVSIFSGTKMNVLHYVLAFFHYTGCILAVLAHSPGFANTDSSVSSQTWKLCYKYLNLTHATGVLVFIYGSYNQNVVHHQYADLRKNKEMKSISMEHRIPHGGWFEDVSCPNYWAEIIIYFSFAVLFGFSNRTWNLILVWVIANQTAAGVMCHKWYLSTFPDYPKNRKAVIPYLI